MASLSVSEDGPIVLDYSSDEGSVIVLEPSENEFGQEEEEGSPQEEEVESPQEEGSPPENLGPSDHTPSYGQNYTLQEAFADLPPSRFIYPDKSLLSNKNEPETREEEDPDTAFLERYEAYQLEKDGLEEGGAEEGTVEEEETEEEGTEEEGTEEEGTEEGGAEVGGDEEVPDVSMSESSVSPTLGSVLSLKRKEDSTQLREITCEETFCEVNQAYNLNERASGEEVDAARLSTLSDWVNNELNGWPQENKTNLTRCVKELQKKTFTCDGGKTRFKQMVGAGKKSWHNYYGYQLPPDVQAVLEGYLSANLNRDDPTPEVKVIKILPRLLTFPTRLWRSGLVLNKEDDMQTGISCFSSPLEKEYWYLYETGEGLYLPLRLGQKGLKQKGTLTEYSLFENLCTSSLQNEMFKPMRVQQLLLWYIFLTGRKASREDEHTQRVAALRGLGVFNNFTAFANKFLDFDTDNTKENVLTDQLKKVLKGFEPSKLNYTPPLIMAQSAAAEAAGDGNDGVALTDSQEEVVDYLKKNSDETPCNFVMLYWAPGTGKTIGALAPVYEAAKTQRVGVIFVTEVENIASVKIFQDYEKVSGVSSRSEVKAYTRDLKICEGKSKETRPMLWTKKYEHGDTGGVCFTTTTYSKLYLVMKWAISSSLKLVSENEGDYSSPLLEKMSETLYYFASAENTEKIFVVLDESHRLRLTPYYVPPRSFDLEEPAKYKQTPAQKFQDMYTDDHGRTKIKSGTVGLLKKGVVEYTYSLLTAGGGGDMFNKKANEFTDQWTWREGEQKWRCDDDASLSREYYLRVGSTAQNKGNKKAKNEGDQDEEAKEEAAWLISKDNENADEQNKKENYATWLLCDFKRGFAYQKFGRKIDNDMFGGDHTAVARGRIREKLKFTLWNTLQEQKPIFFSLSATPMGTVFSNFTNVIFSVGHLITTQRDASKNASKKTPLDDTTPAQVFKNLFYLNEAGKDITCKYYQEQFKDYFNRMNIYMNISNVSKDSMPYQNFVRCHVFKAPGFSKNMYVRGRNTYDSLAPTSAKGNSNAGMHAALRFSSLLRTRTALFGLAITGYDFLQNTFQAKEPLVDKGLTAAIQDYVHLKFDPDVVAAGSPTGPWGGQLFSQAAGSTYWKYLLGDSFMTSKETAPRLNMGAYQGKQCFNSWGGYVMSHGLLYAGIPYDGGKNYGQKYMGTALHYMIAKMLAAKEGKLVVTSERGSETDVARNAEERAKAIRKNLVESLFRLNFELRQANETAPTEAPAETPAEAPTETEFMRYFREVKQKEPVADTLPDDDTLYGFAKINNEGRDHEEEYGSWELHFDSKNRGTKVDDEEQRIKLVTELVETRRRHVHKFLPVFFNKFRVIFAPNNKWDSAEKTVQIYKEMMKMTDFEAAKASSRSFENRLARVSVKRSEVYGQFELFLQACDEATEKDGRDEGEELDKIYKEVEEYVKKIGPTRRMAQVKKPPVSSGVPESPLGTDETSSAGADGGAFNGKQAQKAKATKLFPEIKLADVLMHPVSHKMECFIEFLNEKKSVTGATGYDSPVLCFFGGGNTQITEGDYISVKCTKSDGQFYMTKGKPLGISFFISYMSYHQATAPGPNYFETVNREWISGTRVGRKRYAYLIDLPEKDPMLETLLIVAGCYEKWRFKNGVATKDGGLTKFEIYLAVLIKLHLLLNDEQFCWGLEPTFKAKLREKYEDHEELLQWFTRVAELEQNNGKTEEVETTSAAPSALQEAAERLFAAHANTPKASETTDDVPPIWADETYGKTS